MFNPCQINECFGQPFELWVRMEFSGYADVASYKRLRINRILVRQDQQFQDPSSLFWARFVV